MSKYGMQYVCTPEGYLSDFCHGRPTCPGMHNNPRAAAICAGAGKLSNGYVVRSIDGKETYVREEMRALVQTIRKRERRNRKDVARRAHVVAGEIMTAHYRELLSLLYLLEGYAPTIRQAPKELRREVEDILDSLKNLVTENA